MANLTLHTLLTASYQSFDQLAQEMWETGGRIFQIQLLKLKSVHAEIQGFFVLIRFYRFSSLLSEAPLTSAVALPPLCHS